MIQLYHLINDGQNIAKVTICWNHVFHQKFQKIGMRAGGSLPLSIIQIKKDF